MPAVADAVRALGHYSDLLGIIALLPLISHVKFGGLLQAEERAQKAERRAAAGASPAAPGESGARGGRGHGQPAPAAAEEEPGYLPPTWALLLLLLAELCAAAHLFDPADHQVRRAVGEVARVQRRSKGELGKVLAAVEKLLGNSDVYGLVRFTGTACGVGGLLVSALAGLDRQPEAGVPGRGAAALALGVLRHLRVLLLRPQLLGFAALLAALALGHASLLARLARKPAVAELLRGLPALLRAVGLTGTALASEDSDLMPTFAALHSTAAVARQARFLVHHRLTIPDLMEGSLWGVSTELASARATMAMEAWSMSVLMPAAFAKRRFTTLLPILALPCLILASHGPGVELMEPYLDLAAGRMAFCTAVMALVVLFLGGFPTMVLVIGLGQLLIWIHKLDTLKL